MSTTTNVGTLVRAQQAKDIATRRSRVTTYKPYTLTVRKLTPSSIGVGTGEMEDAIDPRDGRPVRRERLIFLARSQVAVVSGFLREGESIVVDVPSWLAERTGLDRLGLVP